MNKYINKMCFIDDERFWDRTDISPYWFITDINNKSKLTVSIKGIDIEGRKFDKNYLNSFVNEKFYIQDESQLLRELVMNIFTGMKS